MARQRMSRPLRSVTREQFGLGNHLEVGELAEPLGHVRPAKTSVSPSRTPTDPERPARPASFAARSRAKSTSPATVGIRKEPWQTSGM
jgi:hypothetical protein